MTQGAHATSPDSTDPALRAILREVARPRVQTPPPVLVAGRYRIKEPLGSGGMGTVYRALDERLGRQVALKWMHFHEHDGVSEQAFARFVREARAAALVRHPNIVQVLDVSAEPSTPFITMELLEGESLRDRLARGPLSWAEAVVIVDHMLDGLAALHAVGVVHRDIKPSNVFLVRGVDADSSVKVLDLGVAHMTEAEGLGGLTGTGTQLGTPAYMPLEQLRGERVGAAADLYAVGVVLFEMLSGSRPFAARTAADLAVQIATSRAPDLGASHGVSEHQNSVLQRALSRMASERFASAEAFKAALRDEPRAPRPRLRSMVLALLAALVVGGVVAATAVFGKQERATALARDTAPSLAAVLEAAPGPAPEAPSMASSVAPAEPLTGLAAAPTVVDPPAPPPTRATSPGSSGSARRRQPTQEAANVPPPATEPEATPDADPTSPRLRASEFERQAPARRPALHPGQF